MDELISKRAVIEAIEKARANVGHNLERSIGKSIIEILDDVGRDVDRLPSALGTNLAEVGTDLISRAQAIDAVNRLSLGETDATRLAMRIGDYLERLPSAALGTNLAEVGTDAISRQRLLEYIHGESVGRLLCDKYNLDGLIEQLPSAEPAEPKRGRWILDRSGAYCCSECMEPCAGYVMMKPRDKFCKMCGSRNEVTE